MAILVTGATGFLGRQLVRRLVEEGRQVVAVSRQSVPPSLAGTSNLQWISCDLAQELPVEQLPSVEAVVLLAGATLGARCDELGYLRANELTTLKTLESLACRCQQFILASSQVVYGNPQHLSVSETFPLYGDQSAYACSKLNAENWCRWFQRRQGGSYVALRLCGFVDGGGIVDYLIERALRGDTIELFSRGEVRRDYLHSSEAVDAIVGALRLAPAPGGTFMPINIGSGQAVSARELAETVCKELRSSSRIEFSDHSAPQGDFVFDIVAAKKLLGFRPRNLLDTVRAYASSKLANA